MSAVDTVREITASDSPYVGLNFYTEENAAMFFGRDSEQTVLINNLHASRLTLLYAQSGAGKSSLLRAGVASRLAELARRSFWQRGKAGNIPVVFSSWRDDPTVELIGQIQEAIAPFVQTASPPPVPSGGWLDEAIEAATRATDAAILLILDQFEEYFLYRSRETRARPLADELAACINRSQLRVNFLISIREDAYYGLGDLFKGRINNVYGNYFHLEHLTREAAREAIEKPIASFNKLHPHQPPVELGPRLVDKVLGQLGPDQFALDQGGIGRLAEGNGTGPARDEVSAPYLQLVMRRLWDAEREKRSTTLRLKTLEELGGTQEIVRTHVDRALDNLPEEDREAAVDIFHHLVTPSGTKIALAAPDLAEYTGHSAEEADALLERLAGSDVRILRQVPPPPGGPEGTRFEISHDLLAPAILDWGRRRRADRLEHEKDAAQRQAQTEKRRARMFRALAIGSAVLLLVTIGLAVAAYTSKLAAEAAKQSAESSAARAEVALSQLALSQDPDLAALLALRALPVPQYRSAAETALRQALPQLQLKAALAPLPPQRSAVYSADGTQILTAGADGTIRVWDSATDAQLASFSGLGPLNSAALSPDGTQIVIADNDGTARILNARTGKVTGILTPSGSGGYAVTSAAFSPDGRLVVTTYADGIARIWDARTYQQVGPTLSNEQGYKLLSAAFSPDGRLLVTASSSGNARIYDVQTGAQRGILLGSTGLLDASFSPDGKFVVTAAVDGAATVWNVGNDQQLGTLAPLGHDDTANSAAFSPDGRQIVTASGDGVARIWDATNDRLVRAFGTPGSDSLQTAAFSPDGRSVVTASAGGQVRIWDVASGGPVALLPAESGTNPLRAAVLSPDGRLAATGSQFGTVTIWQAPAPNSGTPDWKQVNVISLPGGDAVNGVAFSGDGKLLAAAGESGTAYVWQVPSGLPVGESTSAEGQPLNAVAFDPADPNLVLTADDDGYARLFNVSTGVQVGRPFGASGFNMSAAAFSPDGTRIVTASGDGYARLWNAADQKQIGGEFGSGSSMTSAEFSPSGKEIVTTADDGYTNIWNATASTPKSITSIQEPGTNVAYDSAFTPDGSAVVTAGEDGTAREWDVTTGTQVLAFAALSGPINSVAFSGTELITASSDGSARIWDTEPVEQRALFPGPPGQEIITATFDPADPHIVATSSVNASGSNGIVSVWNTSDQAKPVAVLSVPFGFSAEFSANGEYLVAASVEEVEIWRMSDLSQPVNSFYTFQCPDSNGSNQFLNSVTFSQDGTRVVTADEDGSACVWNASTGQLVQAFREPAGVGGGTEGGLSGGSAMRWAVFSHNGLQVLTASDDGTARLWDIRSGAQLQVFSEPSGAPINDAWISQDGTKVVTASSDGTARIWSATTGNLLQTLNEPGQSPVYNAAFSRNGQLVVTCSGSVVAIWNTQTGQQLTEFPYGTTFSDCEFSPNSGEVVAGGTDGQTRIFSTELAGSLPQIERIAEQRVTGQPTAAELKEYQVGAG